MNDRDCFADVCRVAREVVCDEDAVLTPETTLDDLDMDSLDTCDLAFRLGHEWGLAAFNDDDLPGDTTLGAIAARAERELAGRHHALRPGDQR